MAARSAWKGYLKLSLVSVPVKAYTSTSSGGGEIRLNQLHAECHSRINYKKTCPIHGEVAADQIVSGYEYAKDQYVIIDPDELEKVRTEADKAIKIDAFFPEGALDSVYFNGRNYYLVPEGPVGQKAYAVLLQGMQESGKQAISQVVMHGKEQLGLLRPVDGLLVMTMLYYDSQVTKASAFEEEAPTGTASPEELKLVQALIDASSTDEIDMEKYKDQYTDKLTKLIEAKVAGQELVAPPAQEQAQVINLMDALRQSVEKAQKPAAAPVAPAKPAVKPETPAPTAAEDKPPKKMAPSKGGKKAEARKKKSS